MNTENYDQFYSTHLYSDEQLDSLTLPQKITLGKQLSESVHQVASERFAAGENAFIVLADKYIQYRHQQCESSQKTHEVAKQLKFPITEESIRSQAELHQATRQAKAWAANQPTLKKQDNSASDVYKLGEAAFFKIGGEGESSAGAMETLVWNIAGIMGTEKQFVATGSAEIRNKTQLTGGNQNVPQWNAEDKLQVFEQTQSGLKGGIQVAQRGQVLSEYNQSRNERIPLLSKAEINQGTLTSVVFGMFDAHAGNVFVTEEGNIKFFDNTRSLPNANGWLDRGGTIVFSFRSALLDLPEAQQRLTTDEIEQLRRQVADYTTRIASLKTYLTSLQAQGLLNKLPSGWMNIQSAVGAMEERLKGMENALKSGSVETLQQLAEAAIPGYRLAFVLSYLYSVYEGDQSIDLSPDEVQRKNHTSVGFASIDDIINSLSFSGLDLTEVQKWCNDSSLSMETVIAKSQEAYRSMRPSNAPVTFPAALELYQQIAGNATVDLKDLARSDSQAYVLKYNTDQLKLLGVKCRTADSSIIDSFVTPDTQSELLILSRGEGKTAFCFHKGELVAELDLEHQPGMVKVGGEVMAIKAFLGELLK